jgi:hypothetical protein
MGSRRQPRASFTLPVSVCGTDRKGRAFIERGITQNISREGAAVEGIRCPLEQGDTVVLRSGQSTGRFRVVWVQEPESSQHKKLGLLRLASVGFSEDPALPAAAPDEYQHPRRAVRRQHARYRQELAVELRLKDVKIPMWATTENLSEGGCSVQTPLRVPESTELVIGIWVDQVRIWAQGIVVSSVYGLGTGIKFTDMSPDGRLILRDFLSNHSEEIVDRRQSGQSVKVRVDSRVGAELVQEP